MIKLKFKGLLTQNYQISDFLNITAHLVFSLLLTTWLSFAVFKQGMTNINLIVIICLLLLFELLIKNNQISKRKDDNDDSTSS